MSFYVTNIYGFSTTTALVQAHDLVVDTCQRLFDAKELGIAWYNLPTESTISLEARFDGIIAPMVLDPTQRVLLFQHPTFMRMKWEEAFIDHLKATFPDIKIIFFIEDIYSEMFPNMHPLLTKLIRLYNKADVIIVANQAAKKLLLDNGLTVAKIVYQHMWDCPVKINLSDKELPPFNRLIHFTGNTNLEKFNFLANLDTNSIKMNIYCDDKLKINNPNVTFRGIMEKDSLINVLRKTGGWRFVWGANDTWRNYLAINCSSKLSTYLAAGFPVIVPNSDSQASIVIKNHLGIVVNSLHDAITKISNLSKEEYISYTKSVNHFAHLIRNRHFTTTAITKAYYDLFTTN